MYLGGKRTRRANNRYSSAEYSVGGLDTSGGNMETSASPAESSRPANNAEQTKIDDEALKPEVTTLVDTPRVKTSKERINVSFNLFLFFCFFFIYKFVKLIPNLRERYYLKSNIYFLMGYNIIF